MSAANLGITPSGTSAAGYTTSLGTMEPDPQFASVSSTPQPGDIPSRTVLLPAAAATGTTLRFVLGPAGVTGSSVRQASSRYEDGVGWLVDIVLTPVGAQQWDQLAQEQFHALVAVVVNGEVVSTPLMEPQNTSFSSFSGHLQVAGNLTERTAKTLVAAVQPQH